MTQHDWIMDVLSDLKSFAAANGLPVLARHLDDMQHVAQIELSAQQGMASGLCFEDARAGANPGALGERRTA